MTVRDLYARVAEVCLEPGGFVLGIFSEAQFLHAFASVMLDFAERAPLDKKIFTTMVNAGVAEYVIPEDILEPQLCFYAGRLIEQVSEADLMAGHFEWRRQWGPPRQWHDDNLEIKHFEVFPKPDSNGADIGGDAPPIGKYGDFFPSERNLTIVGTAAPAKTVWALDDPLDVAESFIYYIGYGVLEQIFNGDSELRDLSRANYCHQRYEEGISAAVALARRELLEEDDD